MIKRYLRDELQVPEVELKSVKKKNMVVKWGELTLKYDTLDRLLAEFPDVELGENTRPKKKMIFQI